ncbi:MAG: 2Fe-2S iron-sulfur cluster-binding protein [Hyphomicrobiaceae bacterium]
MHEFIPLKVADVRRETADAVVIGFELPRQHVEAFRFRPGQHLALRVMLGGEEVRRTYSICSGPEDPLLSVAVKRIAGGVFSDWANDAIAPGVEIDSMLPAGRFVLPEPPGEHGHVLAFAAGAGITPIMSMAEHAMVKQPGVRFTLIYGNRDAGSIIFRQRLEDLKDRYLERFTLVHVLSRNEESDMPLLEGRIDQEKVAAFARHVFQVEDVDHAFLCGPGSMIRDVRNALFALGMARERVHHEFFAAGGGAYRQAGAASGQAALTASGSSAEAAGRRAEVVAIIDGIRHRFDVAPGEAIVDAALRQGVRAPYSCKGGMCSTCRAKLVEGKATMAVNYSLEPWELEQDFLLACQARPNSDRVVIDFDQM